MPPPSWIRYCCVSVCPSIHVSACLSVCLSVCPSIHVSACLSVCPSVHVVSVSPCICLSVCTSIVCMSVSPFMSIHVFINLCVLSLLPNINTRSHRGHRSHETKCWYENWKQIGFTTNSAQLLVPHDCGIRGDSLFAHYSYDFDE